MRVDLETARGLLVALLPETFLAAWALLLLLYVAWRHRDPACQRRTGWLSLMGVAVTAGAVLWLWRSGAVVEGLPTIVALDPFRWAVDVILLLGAALTLVLSVGYLDRERLAVPEYHVLVLFATVGMMLMAGGEDLFVIFLGLELLSVAVYVLTGLDRRRPASAEAALKYFLMGAFASAFLLYGIALTYGATGSTKLAIIALQDLPALGRDEGARLLLLPGLGLLLVGFAFKAAAVPFHMWTPDAYDGAPTPVTAYMAAAVKAAAFGALIRVLLEGFAALHPAWDQVIWWLAVITMVVGNLVALVQRSLKRMLAYSSIAHAGYLLAAVAPHSARGAAAFLFYAFFYTLMTVGAFTVLAAKGRSGEREVLVDDLAGLAESHPGMAFAFTVCLLGFPGTAGFIGKWFILVAVVGDGYYVLAATIVLTSVVSAGYYLPLIMAMYMRRRPFDAVHREVALPRAPRLALAASVAALLFFGFFPSLALRQAREGVAGFLPAASQQVASGRAP